MTALPESNPDLPAGAAPALRGISSMATRALLDALVARQRDGHDGRDDHVAPSFAFESVGGVDAAKRVAAGEAFDVVVLAADAIARLAAAGAVVAGSERAVVHSDAALAVPAGDFAPDIGDEEAVRRALLAVPTVGYSTGPSGTRLLELFERWGVAEAMRTRLVQAPPGVPVGRLVAERRVALGFQQLSELMSVPGLTLLGTLPEPIAIRTTFTAAVAAASARPADAARLVAFLASAASDDVKRRHGMVPA